MDQRGSPAACGQIAFREASLWNETGSAWHSEKGERHAGRGGLLSLAAVSRCANSGSKRRLREKAEWRANRTRANRAKATWRPRDFRFPQIHARPSQFF